MLKKGSESSLCYRLLIAVPLKMYRKFGRPNAEIGWKMANGQLLFLAQHAYVPIDNRIDSCTIIYAICSYSEYYIVLPFLFIRKSMLR